MLAVVLASLALSLTARWIFATETADSNPPAEGLSGSGQTQTERDGGSNSVDPRLSLTMLDSAEKAQYSGSGRNIFRTEEERQFTKKAPLPFPAPHHDEIPAAAPHISLQFFGYAVMMNLPRRVFLKDGDALFVAREGDIIDGRYKIVKIGPNSVDVNDLIERTMHTLTLRG